MKTLLLSLLVSTSIGAFGQVSESGISQKILAVYGADEASKVQATTPDRIAYLNFYAENGYEIIEKDFAEGEKMPLLSSVALRNKYVSFERPDSFSPSTFNVLMYAFTRHRDMGAMYRVDGTDFIIELKSESELAKLFNESK